METIITHLVGKEAKKYVTETLDSHTNNSEKYHHPSGLCLKGYYWDEDVWVAFDNTTNDCWVEEFDYTDVLVDDDVSALVSKDSILKAYPLTNIK